MMVSKNRMKAAKTAKAKAAPKKSAARSKKGEDLYVKIQQKAYEIYMRRGQEDGRHMEDWLEAERTVLGKN